MWASNPKTVEYEKMFNCNLGYWLLNGGCPTYSNEETSYDMYHLTEKQINDLIEKSVDDGVNYLFEKAKNYKDIQEYKPNYNIQQRKVGFLGR